MISGRQVVVSLALLAARKTLQDGEECPLSHDSHGLSSPRSWGYRRLCRFGIAENEFEKFPLGTITFFAGENVIVLRVNDMNQKATVHVRGEVQK